MISKVYLEIIYFKEFFVDVLNSGLQCQHLSAHVYLVAAKSALESFMKHLYLSMNKFLSPKVCKQKILETLLT